jgi:mono/diheme cytochrome c family protein
MKNRTVLVAAFALATLAATAVADEHRTRVAMLPAYTQECSSCHVAYPPGLLPAASWQRLMANLPRHFGTDASIDAAQQAALTTWLTASAGRGRRVDAAPAEDRITRSAWFEREHRRIGSAVWQRPAIRSAANCAACHRDATDGGFDEDAVAIPR